MPTVTVNGDYLIHKRPLWMGLLYWEGDHVGQEVSAPWYYRQAVYEGGQMLYNVPSDVDIEASVVLALFEDEDTPDWLMYIGHLPFVPHVQLPPGGTISIVFSD